MSIDGQSSRNEIAVQEEAMRIGFILPGIPGVPTGGSKVIFEYCNWLEEQGHSITVYYLHNKEKSNVLFNFMWKQSLRLKAHFAEPKWIKLNESVKVHVIFSQEDFNRLCWDDVIVATAIETVNYVYNLPKFTRDQNNKTHFTNKTYFIQDYEIWNANSEVVHASYNYGFRNIVVSKWLKELVETYSQRKAYLIPNCINTNIFYEKGNERENHSIVFHYRKAVYKGCKYALAVVRYLFQRYRDLKVYVVSNEREQPELPECCTCYYNLRAEEIADLNNRVQIFMCTTIEEGFGLPGLEGMACGCALVSSKYKGVLEYAVDGENALLSPIGDVDAMIENIIRLFEEPELRNQIMNAGIETGRRKTLENSARELEKVLMQEKGI